MGERNNLMQAESITKWLDDYYKSLFPDAYIQRIDGKGLLQIEMQKVGIDVQILRQNTGYSIYIDEKINYTDFDTLVLEEYSKWEDKIPGWLEKDNVSDFISYAIVSKKLIYFLPYPILRIAYFKNKDEWLKQYKRKFAPNFNYQTSFIPVPWEELKRAMCECMQKES